MQYVCSNESLRHPLGISSWKTIYGTGRGWGQEGWRETETDRHGRRERMRERGTKGRGGGRDGGRRQRKREELKGEEERDI